MAVHNINLELTTQQLTHLNDSLNENYQCNMDALNSKCFEDERLPLLRQCEALQVFLDSIKKVLDKADAK